MRHTSPNVRNKSPKKIRKGDIIRGLFEFIYNSLVVGWFIKINV